MIETETKTQARLQAQAQAREMAHLQQTETHDKIEIDKLASQLESLEEDTNLLHQLDELQNMEQENLRKIKVQDDDEGFNWKNHLPTIGAAVATVAVVSVVAFKLFSKK